MSGAVNQQPYKLLLSVIVEASDKRTVDEMVEQLSRSACDIADSTADDVAHIHIEEHTYTLK